MKARRLLSCALALLLVVSLLPLTALAEGETHITSDQPTNTESNVIIDEGVTVVTNTGVGVTNNGTIGEYNGSNPAEGTGNFGIVGENNGEIGANYGTVKENTEQGKIGTNYGTVEVNRGSIVATKFGTVEVNEVGGYIISDSGDWSENPEDLNVKTNYGTAHFMSGDLGGASEKPAFGVHCLDENGEKVYLGQYLGGSEIEIVGLEREGYKLVDCTAVGSYNYSASQNESEPVFDDITDKSYVAKNEDGTVKSFKIYNPTRLTMTWEKLPSPVKPASGGEEQGADPSLYYIGLGSVIFINEKGYKIVEIRDDTYVVVTFDALPDEDVQDLDALYASLFTPEQQTEIKNLGQLLDDEYVTFIFGKPGNHPVFEIPKDLVN